MSIAQSFLPEFDQEAAVTRQLLARVPEAQAAWKPHDKSMSLGRLAIHVATIPDWVVPTLTTPELDLNPPGGEGYTPQQFTSVAETLAAFDRSVAKARELLSVASDQTLLEPWSLKSAGRTFFTMPRVAVLRSMVFNHMIHHRGQLSVYLRLQDVPLPSIYGPTADNPM
jgi:uncharacterized damage-inducible protein DinB